VNQWLCKWQEADAELDVAEASSLTRLDSCTVQVDPPMTEAMEHLRLPDNLMKQLHIAADTTPTGIVLTGQNTANLTWPYGFLFRHCYKYLFDCETFTGLTWSTN